MNKMAHSRYCSKGFLEKLPSANISKHALKKIPQNNTSIRAVSARPNQLPQILKDYQQFCEKYLNTNLTLGQTTPLNQHSFSVLNQLYQSPLPEIYDINNVNFSFLENNNFEFSEHISNHEYLLNKLNLQSTKQSIGFQKNNKLDYDKRRHKLVPSDLKEDNKENEEKYEDEEFNFKDEVEVDNNEADVIQVNADRSNENDKNIKDHEEDKDNTPTAGNDPNMQIKIFDELTHNIINEEIKNQNATKIQIFLKNQRNHKRRRDRLFLGYDKTGNYIVFIYIGKKSPGNKEFDIYSLLFKIFSFETHLVSYELREIKDLIFNESISNKQISNILPDIMDKVLKQDKDDNSGYDFDDDNHSDKVISNDIHHQSISSIDQFDYDNI